MLKRAALFTIIAFMGPQNTLFGEKTIGPPEEKLDIPYYPEGHKHHDSQDARLNLVFPELNKTELENAPVLIWIEQGAWAYVNRHVEMNICRRFAEAGMVVVSAGHRLSPALLWEPHREEGVKHPEHVKDIAQCIKWLTDHCNDYGFSMDQLFVGGYSSGAHLCALVAMDASYLDLLGLSNEMIKGIVCVGGGFDIPHYREVLVAEDPSYDSNHIQAVFGNHDGQLNASPTEYLDQLITPILLISERDTFVYNTVFEQKLVSKGYQNFQALHAHNETHASLWRNLGDESPSIYRDIIVDYIHKHCKSHE